uniref:Uncharacterized protein n=1 Tax=viral metagenome TaxID=1070528 RepID=A0A6C0IVB2_9ZZZZ
MTQNQFTIFVTFGKYKGRPISAMIRDDNYTEWLSHQPWWPGTWEAQVVEALAKGEQPPPPPARRPLLEYEYELNEPPTKVRRVIHREATDAIIIGIVVCPSCYGEKRLYLTSPNKYLCESCGQHFTISIYQSESTAKMSVQAKPFDCPAWSGKTVEDYRLACENCPEGKSHENEHRRCGCFDNFKCACK